MILILFYILNYANWITFLLYIVCKKYTVFKNDLMWLSQLSNHFDLFLFLLPYQAVVFFQLLKSGL